MARKKIKKILEKIRPKKERHYRSIVKGITWRVLATLTTFIIVLIFIGDWRIAFSVSAVEIIIKIIVYYLHERAWLSIKFGVVKPKKR